jgi:hypothetical protein
LLFVLHVELDTKEEAPQGKGGSQPEKEKKKKLGFREEQQPTQQFDPKPSRS